MAVKDKASGEVSKVAYTVTKDECNRPSTTLESLTKLDPVRLEKDAAATVTAATAQPTHVTSHPPRNPHALPATWRRAHPFHHEARGRS